jgi:hypothetical protein
VFGCNEQQALRRRDFRFYSFHRLWRVLIVVLTEDWQIVNAYEYTLKVAGHKLDQCVGQLANLCECCRQRRRSCGASDPPNVFGVRVVRRAKMILTPILERLNP